MYGFSRWQKIFRLDSLFLLIFWALGGISFSAILIVYPILFLSEPETFSVNGLIEFLVSPFVLYFLYQTTHLQLNKTPQIRWENDGFVVQVFDNFRFRWEKVPWEDVVGVTPEIYFGLIKNLRPAYLIKIKKGLSKWHWQLSRMYGDGTYPAILITPEFPEGEGFLNRLQGQTRLLS